MTDDKKICNKCKLEKPLSSFWKNGFRKDGTARLSSFCNVCHKKLWNANYTTEKSKNYQDKHRNKIRARRKLQYHIRQGNIAKESCWLCGERKVDAHHVSYDYPLKVIWLCSKHHYETHHN